MSSRGLLRRGDATAHLKVDLLIQGIRVTPAGMEAVAACKPGLRTRSGVSGGIDLVLPGDIHVNCTYTEAYARSSPYLLDCDSIGMRILREGVEVARPDLVPRPAWYSLQTTDGTPMVHIGQQCSADRLCIGMTLHCAFWRRDLRCRYCSIGANVSREARAKTIWSITEVIAAAVSDPVLPARHVLVGGGTPVGSDRGAHFAAEICAAIKREHDVSIYVMILPPTDFDDLARLHDAGADELGMNVELFSQKALLDYAPGKARLIGHVHYYRALEHAVRLFGPVRTRSIAITGLEPVEETIRGAAFVASLGVMPILSPFRPLDGSDLSGHVGLSAAEHLALHDSVATACAPLEMVPGPTCIACQNNTLAFPSGDPYRFY
ncbi:MAG: radical SAM protein [bacterium]